MAELVDRADGGLMYASKAAGRNHVTTDSGTPVTRHAERPLRGTAIPWLMPSRSNIGSVKPRAEPTPASGPVSARAPAFPQRRANNPGLALAAEFHLDCDALGHRHYGRV